jgi:hypothetical protein
MAEVVRAKAAAGGRGRDQDRRHRPDSQVLATAGFEPGGRHEFAAEHRWSLPELAGHIRSTSFLPASLSIADGAFAEGRIQAQ